ncbi:SRPBCC family protein [Halorussus lipolyticus]|uniref:SRPBCC family protein n=1 Tax=Halorussus lipolyticus TaxID=3034024 RepID=UPI0023E85F41|nr:SRPBCC family protein [Halorussus sp. DT80]
MVTMRFGRTPDGRRLEVSEEFAASAGLLWNLLTDTTRWPEWGPSVEEVRCPDRRIRAGTTGEVETTFGVGLLFRITTCEDRRWTWKVAGITATGHRVEEVADGGCRVVFEVPLLAAGYSPVCAVALRNLKEMS